MPWPLGVVGVAGAVVHGFVVFFCVVDVVVVSFFVCPQGHRNGNQKIVAALLNNACQRTLPRNSLQGQHQPCPASYVSMRTNWRKRRNTHTGDKETNTLRIVSASHTKRKHTVSNLLPDQPETTGIQRCIYIYIYIYIYIKGEGLEPLVKKIVVPPYM